MASCRCWLRVDGFTLYLARFYPPPLLHCFTPATLLEIDNLLSQSYCDLDPVHIVVQIGDTIVHIVVKARKLVWTLCKSCTIICDIVPSPISQVIYINFKNKNGSRPKKRYLLLCTVMTNVLHKN